MKDQYKEEVMENYSQLLEIKNKLKIAKIDTKVEKSVLE